MKRKTTNKSHARQNSSSTQTGSPLSPTMESERQGRRNSIEEAPSLLISPDYKIKFIEETHQYIREYIRLADQKAAFFFAGSSTLLAFLHKSGVSKLWLRPLSLWRLPHVIAFTSTITVTLASLLMLLVVIPRMGGSRRGILFWEAIAKYENDAEYSAEISSAEGLDLFQAKAKHCFQLARICRAKYRVLRIALWIGFIGLNTSLISFFFL